MNYHKKIQSIGFKRCPALVVCNYDRYGELIDGKKIITLGEYITNKEKEIKNKHKRPISDIESVNIRFIIDDFRIGGTKSDLSKLQTYYLKISDTFTIYISIYRDNYFCFGYDSLINTYPDKYYSKITVNKKAFMINSGVLNSEFWKNILNSLDINYKREIILNQII